MTSKMTKSKRTPGPWEIRGMGPNFLIDARTEGSSYTIGWFKDAISMKGKRLEHCANARLIAAAPELLEALEAIVDAGYLEGAYQPTVDMAIAIIAKARGEE